MHHPDRVECTIGILTFNSAPTLQRTLEATTRFAERIICDGGSTDRTLELARRHGCTVLMQDERFKRADDTLCDFAGAMRQMLEASSSPWFFKIDSDEVPSPELVDELQRTLVPECRADGFIVPLKYVVDGRVIADATTYPMHQLRIVRVDSGLTYSGKVHETIATDGFVIGRLEHAQLLPQPTVRALIPRWWRYLRIEIDEARSVPRRDRWRLHARRHFVIGKYLAWRYTKVVRGGATPRLPLRYEVLRVVNHLVAVIVLLGAPAEPSGGGCRAR